ASLFVDEEAARESEVFDSKGALGGKFERMLFLTATPFQLGHGELMRVLERFEGIAWDGSQPPGLGRAEFRAELETPGEALDGGQASAPRLAAQWGRLNEDNLADVAGRRMDVEEWWRTVSTSRADGLVGQIVEHVDAAQRAIGKAEERLRPWVIRHL